MEEDDQYHDLLFELECLFSTSQMNCQRQHQGIIFAVLYSMKLDFILRVLVVCVSSMELSADSESADLLLVFLRVQQLNNRSIRAVGSLGPKQSVIVRNTINDPMVACRIVIKRINANFWKKVLVEVCRKYYVRIIDLVIVR